MRINGIYKNPIVTIIIPCRNEVNFINKCLSSVYRFDFKKKDFEVLIIDGMSLDGTREILEKWKRKKYYLKIFDNPEKIVPTALNIGIKEANGIWIIRLDAHSIYPRSYLKQCIETAKKTGAENVGGVVLTLPSNKSYEAYLVQSLTTHRFGVGNADFRLECNAGYVDTVPYGCYCKEVFKKIGFFDERLARNQDFEFNRRLIKAGGKIYRDPKIKIQYFNQAHLKGLFKQAVLTGQWNPWMWYIAPYSFAYRHAIPGIFVFSIILLIIFSIWAPRGMILLLFIVSTYFLLAIKTSVDQSQRHRLAVISCIAFSIFNISFFVWNRYFERRFRFTYRRISGTAY